MDKDEKLLVKGKKIEAIIALFLLLPPVLGVISFVIYFCLNSWDFDHILTPGYESGVRVHYTVTQDKSEIPTYLGLMAIAGVYLLKDPFRYLFIKLDDKSKQAISKS